jgi:hypothetical protein
MAAQRYSLSVDRGKQGRTRGRQSRKAASDSVRSLESFLSYG